MTPTATARAVLAALAGAAALSGCGAATTTTVPRVEPAPRSSTAATATAITTTTLRIPTPAVHSSPPTVATPRPTTTSRSTRNAAAGTLPLAGKIVGVDPGHNGGNFDDPSYINHLIWNGREMETCNTTGTATDGGYTEAQYNFNVATYLAADLRAEGASVVMTRHTNTGVGPCVNLRAQIIDAAHANVAIDIHADGGPPDGRGFAILEPVADGINNRIIAASEAFGRDLRGRFQTVTGMPESTYDGTDGIVFRDNLAGLNLTTVPEVLIETGNMRNATDAAMLTSASFQQLAAKAIAQAITLYLTGRV
ncbi:MAG: N-acetylmuramoyl-L-alanine amidase [Solirubrobacteraceae bacterium]